MPVGKAPGALTVKSGQLNRGRGLSGDRFKVLVTENAGHGDNRQDKGQQRSTTRLTDGTTLHNTWQEWLFSAAWNWDVAEVLKSWKPHMHIDLKTWAIAVSVALLSALGAAFATRPASPSLTTGAQLAGRDHPSVNAPNPLTADEIGYRVPRERIRAIDAPIYMAAAQAGFVPDRLPVIGVAEGAEAKAYPIPLLSRVEIVNDQIGGRAIAVTW